MTSHLKENKYHRLFSRHGRYRPDAIYRQIIVNSEKSLYHCYFQQQSGGGGGGDVAPEKKNIENMNVPTFYPPHWEVETFKLPFGSFKLLPHQIFQLPLQRYL